MRIQIPLLALLLLVSLAFAPPVGAEPEAPPVVDEPAAIEEPAAPSDAAREQTRQFVEALRADVARIRGLEWKHDVPADLLTRDQLRANMIEMATKELDPEELERDTRIMRRLGLLGPDDDPFQMMIEAMGEMVGGYYDPEEKRLFLIEGMTGDSQKPVVFHELVHALEDQHLGLKARMEAFKDDSDRMFAEKCLGEGSAEHARILYQAENPGLTAAYRRGQQDPDMMRRQLKVMAKIPAFMIVPTLMHYGLGPALVKRAVGDDFPGGMKALYEDPPVSQEQFLHPSKWLGEMKDYPQKAVWGGDFPAIAGEGWEKAHDMPVGEVDLASYLDFFLGRTNGKIDMMLMQQGKSFAPDASKAAAGWDGGQAYYMVKEGFPAAWIEALIFDTEVDATEAVDAMLVALKKANGDSFVVESSEAADESHRTWHYVTRYGPGRMQQRGVEMFLADGVPAESMDAIWAATLATTFEKDPRDTFDASKVVDPLEACDLADRDAGWGVRLTGEGWTVEKAGGRPGLVAEAKKGAVTVQITVAPVPREVIEPIILQQLKAGGVNVDARVEVKIAGQDGGARYAGPRGLVYLGGVAGKTIILAVQAENGAGGEVLEELDALAADMVIAGD